MKVFVISFFPRFIVYKKGYLENPHKINRNRVMALQIHQWR